VTPPRRGEIWWGEIEGVGRRPFLVMTRSAAIPVLQSVLVAPLTRTIRGIPTEVQLDESDGMPVECAASFDNLRVVPTSLLLERQCTLDSLRMLEACDALKVATDC